MPTASSSSIISIQPFTGAGALVKVTFGLFRNYFGQWFGIVFRVAGLILLLNIVSGVLSALPFLTSLDANTASPVNLGLSIVASCVGVLVAIASIFVPWMNGALFYQTFERIAGRAPSVSDSYRATQSRFGGLWVNTFLSQAVHILLLLPLVLGIYGGITMTLINEKLIPGLPSNFNSASMNNFLLGVAGICTPMGLIGGLISLILSLSWAVTGPTIVAEGVDGFGAFSRSGQLTKGKRLALLGRFIVFGLVTWLLFSLPVMLLGGVSALPLIGAAPGDMPILSIVLFTITALIGLVLNVSHMALQGIFMALNYLDLRSREELSALPEVERVHRAVAMQSASVAAKPSISTAPPVTATVASRATPAPVIAVPALPSTAGYASNSAANYAAAITPNMTPAQKIGVYFTRLRNEGPSVSLLSDMGACYFEVGDIGAALDAYSRARALNPNDATTAFNLLQVHIRRKDTNSAREMMSEYLNLETNENDKQRVMSNPAFRPFLP
ncbi:MAG: tetratricopeptide repeat protein [Anaerolineae bacterium]|nr:tetratricopeptide repeat protein [Anaerolineae bacterium]